ncbi:hypothetical protein CONPUDRAFT_46498, partial [Coniophora puteana RWD-64-598 SS2]
DGDIAPAIVRQGFIPCAPDNPKNAVSLRTLDLYRTTKMRDPHLSIQAFVKTTCDLHAVIFDPQLPRHFSIAFDIYLQVLGCVEDLVRTALRRESPDWRLAHVCPPCTYRVKDEPDLKFSLLYTMDGNDSLKRAFKRTTNPDVHGYSASDLPTKLKIRSDRYINREEVNGWANATLDQALTDQVNMIDNPCAGRWKNMKEDITKKMWSVFDETGIFLAVCRHGFSLLVVDMIKSGELAKYPIAIVERMLKVFGKNLCVGYDIGCKFKTTLLKSRLGDLVRKLNHTCLVGAFHGHAHRRACQVDYLTTYVEGIGLEDFEGCERKYSKTNPLAGTTRHANAFHRQQYIDTYLHYSDEFDVYPALTTFMYNNYRQALKIIREGVPSLDAEMRRMKIANASIFATWLAEEKTYLRSLEKEPAEETLHMEYWEKLVNLRDSKYVFTFFICAASTYLYIRTLLDTLPDPSTWTDDTPAARKRSDGVRRRHAQENYDRDMRVVQELESQLEVEHRWEEGSDDWVKTGRMVAMRSYQRALDKLEGLIVARIFELNSMNKPGMGYALRQHIGKALKARASAIRTALQKYNIAAAALNPPRSHLSWDDVVNYAFLADFDLLRDTRQDISTRDWAKPAARSTMDLHFKICRAREEIVRLDVEVKRMATYLHDEDRYLIACEEILRPLHAPLAMQVAVYRSVRARCNEHHWKRLRDIAKLEGFTGSIDVGEGAQTGLGESASTPCPIVPPTLLSSCSRLPMLEGESDLEDTDDDDEEPSPDSVDDVDDTQELINAIFTLGSEDP